MGSSTRHKEEQQRRCKATEVLVVVMNEHRRELTSAVQHALGAAGGA